MPKRFLLFLGIVCLFSFTFANSKSEGENSSKNKESFDAGEFIFHHILDEHQWKIAQIGTYELTVPLPVILWHQGNLYCFSSSKLQEHQKHLNFQLRETPPYKGKIVYWTTNTQGTAVISPKLPLDFSITKNVVGLFVSAILMIIIFTIVSKSYKKRGVNAPKGLQSLIELIIVFLKKEVIDSNLDKRQGAKMAPYIYTLFFFILINNLSGLIPIIPFGTNLMGNIAITGILAFFTFLLVLFKSRKTYWTHIFNTPGVPWWVKIPIPIIPLIEFMEVFTKPFILMIRLFANMIAGHIVILGFISLIFIFGSINSILGYALSPLSIAFSLFVNALEILVSFIQAYIFVLLTCIYVGSAVQEKHPVKTN